MKKNEDNPVVITIKSKDYNFKMRIPLWRAYLIMADLELQKKKDKSNN